ncbi:hypothetical protein E8K88_02735 [Lampropedia aestuarii]|uniref:Uncharacterized protein n=1 Tax=Lampropedia aestuarii TaxID=2562762 RepID=A0A4S5BTJ5_9BURK|nr:hypothetical protein [Lampropedia aestuarii]THJ36197.1 hypothetical protein E8K88_02735 [Lampropedia aestuarii]
MHKDQKYEPPSNCYQGVELRLNPGIDPERLRAFTLPSRVGDQLHYPDGRIEAFPYPSKEAKP